MALKNNLKAWRELANLTIEQLAERVDTSTASISRIETGSQQPRPALLRRFCSFFSQPEAAFYSGEVNVIPVPMGSRRIPVLDYVQAGNWRGMTPNFEEENSIWTDHEYSPRTFALRIIGDSMLPRFHEGDVVIIDPDVQPRPNEFVIAKNGADEATFKQYKERGIDELGRKVVELVSLNDGHPSWRSDRQEFEIQGTMLEHRQYSRRQ